MPTESADSTITHTPPFLKIKKDNGDYLPQFFRLHNKNDLQNLETLLQQKPFIRISDTLASQLNELLKALNPAKKFTPELLVESVQQHTHSAPLWQYGVWVYYPWNERLVHILDETEFALLRTNRNRNKITEEERQLLSTKKIGVIGLSVGQSVSVTLAMERSFGELRIADFDELEITNLNRLRSGIHNMGIAKTVLVAREIAEIDPFLKVVPFHNGITQENLNEFLTGNGKLDVLIDECDSVDVKIQCRTAAKKLRIPVLMEASDRATIDVERFDLEPERPILHGFIDHLDISKLKDLKTSEEKLPYMLPIAGVETLSVRMKASALEIGQTINTWPQLASAVTMGGGITADICRRMLLDQFHQSGRYFMDVEELIGDPKKQEAYKEETMPELTKSEMQEAIKALQSESETGNVIPDEAVLQKLMEAASLAPSAGNNQPWKWYFDGRQLWLFHDVSRSFSFGDFENMASYMALGAALKNVELAAATENLETRLNLFPGGAKKNPVAAVIFQKPLDKIPESELAAFIPIRYTNRRKGDGKKIPETLLNEIAANASSKEGATVHFISEDGKLKQLAEIISQSERLRVFIPQGHYDLFEKEIRWDAQHAAATKDGLDLSTFDFTPTEAIGLRLARDPQIIPYLQKWKGGQGLAKMSREAVESFGAVGLITMPAFTPENCVLAGKTVEQVWLSATKHQLAMQPMLAPLLHFMRLRHGEAGTMPEYAEQEFRRLEIDFLNIFGLNAPEDVTLFLFRLGYAAAPEVKSYRLPMEKIFFRGELL